MFTRSEPIRQVTPEEVALHTAQGVWVSFTGNHGTEDEPVLERITGLVSAHSTTHILLVSGRPGCPRTAFHLSRVVGMVDVLDE